MGESAETKQVEFPRRWPREAPWSRKRRTLIKELISFALTIALTVFCATALKLFVIDIYEVPTGSMSPTISIGDRIIAEKISIRFSKIKQFDIVTFTDPVGNNRTLVKRVIAVAGQTVDLRGGYVYVDNVMLDEPYTLGRPSDPLMTHRDVEVSYPYTVPDGHVWVMGDNRTDSADSRYFGSVDVKLVTGRGVIVVWPPEHFSGFK